MRRFIVKSFLQGICAIGLCLLLYGRAHAQEFIGQGGNLIGFACTTSDHSPEREPCYFGCRGGQREDRMYPFFGSRDLLWRRTHLQTRQQLLEHSPPSD